MQAKNRNANGPFAILQQKEYKSVHLHVRLCTDEASSSSFFLFNYHNLKLIIWMQIVLHKLLYPANL
ncbi:hypothetical protein RYX45_25030, partial [Alkalihalophilus pseudofirmus]